MNEHSQASNPLSNTSDKAISKNGIITEQDAAFMEAMFREVKLNLSLAHKMTTMSQDIRAEPSTTQEEREQQLSRDSISDQSSPSPYTLGFIESLYQERPGLNFLSDYDQELSHKERNATKEITQQDIADMKAMVREVRLNPSKIYEKFDLPWNHKIDLQATNQSTTKETTKQRISNSAAPMQAQSNRWTTDDSNIEHFSPDCVIKATQGSSSDQFPRPPYSHPSSQKEELAKRS